MTLLTFTIISTVTLIAGFTLIAPRDNFYTRLVSLLFFIPVGLFSILGIIASFESGENHIYWRVFYFIVFTGSIWIISRLFLMKKVQKTNINKNENI